MWMLQKKRAQKDFLGKLNCLCLGASEIRFDDMVAMYIIGMPTLLKRRNDLVIIRLLWGMFGDVQRSTLYSMTSQM